MKQKILTAIIAVVLGMSMTACHNKKATENMSDEEKLEIINIRLKKTPKDAELLYDRAGIYINMERYNDAITDLTKATELEPNKKEYHALLGDTYFRTGDVEHSYKSFERVIELDGKDKEAYLKLGEIAFYSKDYDRAMEHLSKVTADDPNNQNALFMKGFIYKETEDTAKAAHYFRKVIELYPEYEPAYEELGFMYANHGSALAVEYLTTAIKLEPNNTQAIYGLAMYFQEHNRMDEAEELYSRITEINPAHKDAWHNLGYIECFHYGDYEKAIEYFNRAIECDSRFVEALANRGWAYALKGDKTNARINYNSALEIDPAYKPAVDGLAEL
jgi:tetratricopeptide (TPR) repeat protein